jgi:hypothetical protein
MAVAGGSPFQTRRRQLQFDIFPAGQQQAIVATQPTRGGAKFLAASSQYLSRAGDATNCNLFNFRNDGVTTAFSIGFWIKFDSFTNTDTIMCKAVNAAGAMSGSNCVWALQLGGTGKRLDLYASTGSATPSVTWSLSALSTGVWYFFVISYLGSGGASKAQFYLDSVLQATPNSASLPQLFQNNNASTCEFAIGRRTAATSDGHTFFNGELQQIHFHNAVLTQSDVTNEWNSGAGTESSQYGALGSNFSTSRIAQYDLDEDSGAARLDGTTNHNDLTDHATVATKLRVIDFIENSPHYLTFKGGAIGPSNASTRSRKQEPWIDRDKFGAGKHGIAFDVNSSTLYCPTTILQGQVTGNYFWAGVWDTVVDNEFFEMNAGDDTVATGSSYGNNHSMFMGMYGPTSANLTAGQYAPIIRPDGTSMPAPFGGVIHNLNAALPAGGAKTGNSYPPSGIPVVIERSLIAGSNSDYRIALNGVTQTIIADGLTGGPQWWDAFICNFIMFGYTNSSASGFTLGRACCFGPTLSDAERLHVNQIMKSSIGL